MKTVDMRRRLLMIYGMSRRMWRRMGLSCWMRMIVMLVELMMMRMKMGLRWR
jgi:hypothetical protein